MIDSAAAGVSYTSFGFSKNKEPLFQAKEAEKARIEARKRQEQLNDNILIAAGVIAAIGLFLLMLFIVTRI